jgi:hypothetical protein
MSFTNRVPQFSWFYKPPSNGDLTQLTSNFNNFILTKGDESTVTSLKSMGVTTPILQYVRGDAIEKPASPTATTLRNQVAYKQNDFRHIKRHHKDWFLRSATKKIIRAGSGTDNHFMMDPGNIQWQAFWLSRVMETQANPIWDGVFIDNMEASLGKRIKAGAGMPVKYPTDTAYQAAVKSFLTAAYNCFNPSGKIVFANIVSLASTNVWLSYLSVLDGAMKESWALDWHTGYLTVSGWMGDVDLLAQTETMGRHSIFVCQGQQSNSDRQQFAYASYLLVACGNTSFRYSNYDSYTDAWLYTNYGLDLGLPLGPRYQVNTTWKRDFEFGYVQVDPWAHTAQIVVV